MNIEKTKFVVISRTEIIRLVDDSTSSTTCHGCLIESVVSDSSELLRIAESDHERNQAITGIKFNLPFVIGKKIVIPINIAKSFDDPDSKILSIFGHQTINIDVGK